MYFFESQSFTIIVHQLLMFKHQNWILTVLVGWQNYVSHTPDRVAKLYLWNDIHAANHDRLSLDNLLICNNQNCTLTKYSLSTFIKWAQPTIRHKNIFKMTPIRRKQVIYNFGTPKSHRSNSSQGFGDVSENDI